MSVPHPELVPICADDLAFRVPGTSAWQQAALVRATVAPTPENPDPARSWELGAEGEEQAAQVFTGLGPGWYVLHDMTVTHTGTNVDHVLIGPPGVFVVNTKNRKNGSVVIDAETIFVNGEATDYLDKALYERDIVIDRLADMLPSLPFPILSVLLFLNARDFDIADLPATAFVCNEYNLVNVLHAMEARYTPEQTWMLFNQMRNPVDWLPAPAPARSNDPLGDLFETVFTDVFAAVGSLFKPRRGAIPQHGTGHGVAGAGSPPVFLGPDGQPVPSPSTPARGGIHPVLLGCGIVALAGLLAVVFLVWLLVRVTGF